jgi:RimJ/RimL family protein N-acetyltransferase
MRVHPDNAAALRCYAAAGFEPADTDQAAGWNRFQPVAYVWLTLAAR